MAAPWTEHGEQQQPCEEETKYPAGVKPVIHLQNRRGNGDRPAALHERGVNALRFRAFKWPVYGLLALNSVLFLLSETLVEALDSLGWLVLLGVLEWETSTLGRPRSARRARQAVRGVLYAGLVALAVWWATAGELLNGFDAALWLLCFFAVEGNILRHENTEPAPCG